MSLQDEIVLMEKSIMDLVTVTLTHIRKSSPGTDIVLDDKDEAFKLFFLKCAKEK